MTCLWLLMSNDLQIKIWIPVDICVILIYLLYTLQICNLEAHMSAELK
jgi:hypothetical protein